MYHLNHIQFSGASGPVQFSGADRSGIINVNQQIGESYVMVGLFSPDKGNITDQLYLNESMVKWLTPDGLRPSDGTPREFIDIISMCC